VGEKRRYPEFIHRKADREGIPLQWATERAALEFYASEENIEGGLHGHYDESVPAWVPDMGYRAEAALHGRCPDDEAVVADLKDSGCFYPRIDTPDEADHG
jgi:hypothetical protein